jgi:hypothetical protein
MAQPRRSSALVVGKRVRVFLFIRCDCGVAQGYSSEQSAFSLSYLRVGPTRIGKVQREASPDYCREGVMQTDVCEMLDDDALSECACSCELPGCGKRK